MNYIEDQKRNNNKTYKSNKIGFYEVIVVMTLILIGLMFVKVYL